MTSYSNYGKKLRQEGLDINEYRELNNGSGADLENGEVAVDVNRGGTGAVAIVWKSDDGATTGYVDLTTGY